MNSNEKIKNILWVSIIIMVLTIAYSAISYTNSFSKQTNFSSGRFTVVGEGKVVAIPDIAKFNFGVLTQGGKDVASLQDQNTKKMNDIIAFIKSNGIDKKDIKTTGYSIQPRYEYYKCNSSPILLNSTFENNSSKSCPPPKIVGYTIRQNVTVKIRDFKKAGDILTGVSQKGVNSVSQLSFSVDDKTKFENEAREKAIKQAKEKASAIAKSAGFSLGSLVSLNESKRNYYPIRYSAIETKSSPSPRASVTVEPGSQDIISNVTLQYQIK